MTELAGLLPEYSIVMGFRGVGRILGPQIMAEVGDVLRFEKKESLVCFAGLEAPHYESGKFESHNRTISKKGSPHLRAALFQVMDCLVKTQPVNDPVFQFIDRKRSEGKHYRFKKQQFNLEDMRVRLLNSIRNLELLITIALGYIGFVSEKCEERITVMQLIECSKRIFGTNNFIFYAVAAGLFALLAKYKQGINHMIFNSPKHPRLQLSIFGSQPFT